MWQDSPVHESRMFLSMIIMLWFYWYNTFYFSGYPFASIYKHIKILNGMQSLSPATSAYVELSMSDFRLGDLKWIKPHLRDIIPPLWISIYRWTLCYESIQFNILCNYSAPITPILSMVLFRNCNIILSLLLYCSIVGLTLVQTKTTTVSKYSRARSVLHEIFAVMEWKYSDWFFGSVGGSGLNLCGFYFLVTMVLWTRPHQNKMIASWMWLFILISSLLSSSSSMSMCSKVWFLALVMTKSPKCFSMASRIIVLTFGLMWDTFLLSTYQNIIHCFPSINLFSMHCSYGLMTKPNNFNYSHKGHTKVETIQCIHIEPSESSN